MRQQKHISPKLQYEDNDLQDVNSLTQEFSLIEIKGNNCTFFHSLKFCPINFL